MMVLRLYLHKSALSYPPVAVGSVNKVKQLLARQIVVLANVLMLL
ncbi:hypothetical protein [Nostoc mirabile]|nr:hypothetical protein [Nostoc mirabile]